MARLLTVSAMCVASFAIGLGESRPQEQHSQMVKAIEEIPEYEAMHAASAMSSRLRHLDLLATSSNLRVSRGQGLRTESEGHTVELVLIPLVVVLVLIVVVVLAYGNNPYVDSPASTILLKGEDASGTAASKVSPRMSSRYGSAGESPIPSRKRSPFAPPVGDGTPLPEQASPPAAAPKSMFSSAFAAMSPFPQQRQPSSASPRPQGLLQSSLTPMEVSPHKALSIPPSLCPAHAPKQARQVLTVSKAAFPAQLFSQGVVEVLGGGSFAFPVAYARLATGPEGQRLEMVTEPSWMDPEVIVGPLGRGYVAEDASIYGPDRELYGPFQQTSTGFAVGHYAAAGNVVLVTPKRMLDGPSVEVTSGIGMRLGALTSQGANTSYQIEIAAGVDENLAIACILASVVASPTILDEVYTSI